ncbi:MAG: hypothetical protein ABI330_15045, partial [Caldimonas sp.]
MKSEGQWVTGPTLHLDGGQRAPATRSIAREYFTVDLRRLRTALAARAAADAMTESDVLRSALVVKLGADAIGSKVSPSRLDATAGRRSLAKLSVRLARSAAQRLDQNCCAAGLSRGAYLTRLIDGVAPLVASTNRTGLAHSLNHSADELAVLSRDIYHLAELLGQGSSQAARAYTQRLETLDADVRAHLKRDATVLAELSAARSTGRPRSLAITTSLRRRAT